MLTSERPSKKSQAVITETAIRASIPLGKWLENHKQEFDDDERAKSDLIDGLLDHYDGFRLACFLETSCGWIDVDSELVRLLDGMYAMRDAVLRSAIRQWVAANNIAPRFRVGSELEYLTKHGTILVVRPEDAEYGFLTREDSIRYRSLVPDYIPIEQFDAIAKPITT